MSNLLTHQDDFLKRIRATRKPSVVKIERPESSFPELVVTVPDSWPKISLAPLYDVHIGSVHHDREMFARHLKWIRETPYLLTWNGGDLIDNSSKLSVGSGVYENDMTPQKQSQQASLQLAGIAHKMLFSIPGNHEDRTDLMGFSLAEWFTSVLEVPYFLDYCFCTIKWRGNNFRILAHHGSGAAQTAGAQRMAARKAIAAFKPFDIYWTGHLHNPLVDVLFQTDVDQSTGRMFERNAMIIISPSYLRYFGSYAAKKQYTPGTRGLACVVLQPDGRIDTDIHANGKRL